MSTKKRQNPLKERRLASFNLIEKLEKSYKENISVSFEFFVGRSLNGEGQLYSDWNQDQLEELLTKFKNISENKIGRLQSDQTLVIYDDYPPKSLFECPSNIPKTGVSWARFKLDGKTRICGFFLKSSEERHNVFYLVFLDKEHHFYPTSKKHT